MNPTEVLVRVLEDPIFQVLAFALGPFAFWKIVRANKARHAVKGKRASARGKKIEPGFRGLRWGQDPTPDMALYHDGLVEKLYTRPADALRFGKAPLKSIVYSFHLGRLQAVMIEVPRGAAPEVLDALTADWGKPRTLPSATPKRYWNDLGTGADAMQAIFDEAPYARYASLILSSKLMAEQRGWRERAQPARRPAPMTASQYAMEAAR